MSNQRRFKHTDNKLIFNTLQKIVQIKAKIEEQCVERKVSPAELPMSMMPTEELYLLTACFEAMYDKLLNEELIVNGYPKTNLTKH